MSRAYHHHGAPAQLGGILLQLLRILMHIGGRQVVGNDVLQEVEPEQGELGQHSTLLRNAGGQHIIECGDPIGRDEQQMIVVDPVNVANFPAGVQLQVRKVSIAGERRYLN